MDFEVWSLDAMCNSFARKKTDLDKSLLENQTNIKEHWKQLEDWDEDAMLYVRNRLN
jgi:hypothetical protein